MKTSADASEQARSLVSGRLGLDFHGQRLHDLERAVARASRAAGASPTQYLARLATLPDESPEWRRLATQLTVGETYFFRERPCFDALEQRVLPAIVAERRAQGIPRLRLWSAGCSTGEEPYSLAILIDRMLPDRKSWTITILGTDVDPEALEKARRGVYREWSFRTTPRWLRNRYFRPRGDCFALDDHIRKLVTFAPLNLVADTYPALTTNTTAFDVILCRNVLMYLTRRTQRATAAKLADALLPGGWLALGAAEGSAELTDSLVRVDLAGAVFGRKERRIAAPGVDQPPEPTPDVDVEPQSAEAWPVALEVPDRAPQPEPEAVESIDPTSALERARAAADRGSLEEAAELCRLAL
jgi:chemotaxis protein methyltransferase CheR